MQATSYHPPPNRSSLLKAALACAEAGKPVFPCRAAPDKSPLTRRGHHDATTQAAQVSAYWNANPGASIGVPAGAESGFWVLDVDAPDALEALEREYGPLPDTLRVRTPRGGLHIYFRHVEGVGNKRGSLPAGMDVRGGGKGYVLVPPSPGYAVEVRAEIAPAPAWLLEMVRAEPEPGRKEPRGSVVSLVDDLSGDPIPEGRRNETLYRLACRWRAQGQDRAAILDALERVEVENPATLEPGELEKIAQSAARHEPGNAGAKSSPEVLERLESIEAAHLWGREWKGSGWKTPRSVMAVLIREARRHGRESGANVEVSISVRALALAAGVSKQAVVRKDGALDKLRAEGLIESRRASGTKAGAYILRTPAAPGVANHYHSSTGGLSPASGNTYPRPLTAPRLRYSKPVYDRVDGVSERVGTILRLGKSAEHVLDVLETEPGGMSDRELAAALGIKGHRELRRRILPRLEAAGVIERSGDNVRLRLDWLAALDRRREEDEEIADHERDRAKYRKESENYRNRHEVRRLRRVGLEYEEIAEALGLPLEDVRPALRGPDPAPTLEEMSERRESAPARRREGIEAAIVALFRDRPEYRERRVGQITARLVFYLAEPFPRGVGPGGAPKDEEVREILEANGAEAVA